MAARHGAGEEENVLPTFHVAIAGWDPLSKSGRGIERALEEAQERMSGANSRQRAMEESERRWKQLHRSMYDPSVAVPGAAKPAQHRETSTLAQGAAGADLEQGEAARRFPDRGVSPPEEEDDADVGTGAFITDLPDMDGAVNQSSDSRGSVWRTNFFVLGFMTEVLRNLGELRC
mmetsp:Transcript_3200/g.10821  ORF Transcript_3200/g.10821 Transcript_3200/m.10821 type:complete len:175 (+) Transcript_3200:332-856(+)